MPGWQIALIALGAALVAATVAVVLDRALGAPENDHDGCMSDPRKTKR